MERKHLYESLSPIINCAKVFGLITSQRRHENTVKTIISFIWSIAITVLPLAYVICNVTTRFGNHFGNMIRVWDVATNYAGAVAIAITVASHFVQRKKIGLLINNIAEVDTNVIKLNPQFPLKLKYQTTKLWSLFTVSAILSYFFIVLTMQVVIIMEGDLMYFEDIIVVTLPIVITSIMEIEFCLLVLLLWQRSSWLNSAILRIRDKICLGSNFKKFGGLVETQMIHQVKQIYGDLCAIGQGINQAFSVQLLILLFKNFLGIIMVLFFWVTHAKDLPTSLLHQILLHSVLIVLMLQLLVIVIVCSISTLEAKKTGALIHDVLPSSSVSCNRRALQMQLSCFSLLLAHKNVEFTACNFFVINETLLFSIVGTASAYLVIVVQFELSSL